MKQYLLFIDAETTGLIKHPRNEYDLKDQPYLLQVSYILCNSKAQEVKQHNYLIKPDNFKLSHETNQVHNRKYEKALIDGHNIKNVLIKIDSAIKESYIIIGHNINFEKLILEIEFERNGLTTNIKNKLQFCTMIDYYKMKIKSKDKMYKKPTLEELSINLLGKSLIKKQNSIENVRTIFQCFWEMKKLNLIFF